MQKYTDEDIRNMNKITCKIAADYLGISPMAVSMVYGIIFCQLVLQFTMRKEIEHILKVGHIT